MKNKLIDLNNHLFAQLERLSEEDLSGDKLAEEMNRAKAITGIASQIIANGNLVLNGIKTKELYFSGKATLPAFFVDPDNQSELQSPKNLKAIPGNLKEEFGRTKP